MNDLLVQLCIDLFLPAYKARSGFVCPLGIRALDAYIYICMSWKLFLRKAEPTSSPPNKIVRFIAQTENKIPVLIAGCEEDWVWFNLLLLTWISYQKP